MMMRAIKMGHGLQGKRILLVEDNFLIANSLRKLLATMGCEVVGPVPTLDQAEELAGREALDGAILDINIIGGTSLGVAAMLRNRGCPFFFITGYGSPEGVPENLAMALKLNKPIDAALLQSTCMREFAKSN
jgi:DNA-binding NtrC family response regulator